MPSAPSINELQAISLLLLYAPTVGRLEMMRVRFRSPAVALAAAVALSATPLISSTFLATVKRISAEISLRSDVALIMGGTGMPDPTQVFLDEVNNLYIQPNFPGYEPVGLHTPEEAFPIYGLLSGYASVTQGVEDLNTAITHTYAGDNLVIFGVSQSALIASLEEQQLAANPPAHLGELHFALLAGPDNPMGGLFERFAGLDNPLVDYNYYPPPRPTFFRPTSTPASTTAFRTFRRIHPISWPSLTRSRVWGTCTSTTGISRLSRSNHVCCWAIRDRRTSI